MKNRKRIIIPIVFLAVIGSSLISNNELKNVRPVDIAQLIAFGILLGVLIVNLKTILWDKK